MDVQRILKNHFGLSEFRPGQIEIISSILTGRDVIALLPTGGGKSLCYQVPAVALGGTTIVISPLISLMEDQVSKLQSLGIRSAVISSAQKTAEKHVILNRFTHQELQFLYVSPETFLRLPWFKLAKEVSVPLIVIDEAHCITLWGNDFRPEYRRVAEVFGLFANRPQVVAFTATASPETIHDISQVLQLISPNVLRTSSYRANLHVQVHAHRHQLDRDLSLLRILLHHQSDTGIIYAATRESCEKIVKIIQFWLNEEKSQKIAYFHAGLDTTTRSELQLKFARDEIRWLVATNAFGMGVDKGNVRFVVHFQPSTSIENYYQEIGRGGRDGQVCNCYLLWCPSDWEVLKDLVTDDNRERTKFRVTALAQMQQYCLHKRCRLRNILTYFGEDPAWQNCGHCDGCGLQTLSQSLEEVTLMARWQVLTAKLQQHYPAFPALTLRQLQYLAVLQPQNAQEMLAIPGVGTGWLKCWFPVLQPWLAKLYASALC